MILAGYSGSGKTTSIRGIIKLMESNGMTYTLLAPTGKASRRITESVNRQASTIHRKALRDGEISTDVLIVDEMSMTDLPTFLMMLNTIDNPNIRVVEMDTVEGTKGGKVLQTFLWRENNLMLAFLLENKMMESAVSTIDKLEMALGIEKFKELFPVILTDNGSEFADPDLFEVNRDGEIRTSIYYCDSRKPEQKGSLEKNHEYIRYVVPKGKPFDDYIQEQITMMINNINSTIRPQSGKSPAAMAMESFGEDVMKKLGLTIVEPDEVHLMPSLLK